MNPHTDIILPKRSSEINFTMPYTVKFPLTSILKLSKDKVKERSEDKFLVQAIIYAEEDLSLDVME